MWVAMGSLSSFAVSIFSTAILSRYLDKTEYGTYRQIIYIYNTLIVIFAAGLPRIYAYYLPRYNIAQGKDIVKKVTNILFLAGSVFSIFLFTSSELIADVLRNPELGRGLKWFSPIPMLMLPTLGLEGIFSSYKKAIYIAIYNTISRLLILLFIVLPVLLFYDSYVSAIFGWIAASVVILFIAYLFKGIPFKGITKEESGLNIKEILTYSLPLAGASIAGIAIKAADQFYVSRYFGTEIFAEFANGFIELPFAYMITGATATILLPLFSKIIQENSNKDDLVALWQNALNKSSVIIYPMLIYCMFFSKEIVTVLYSERYSDSAIYFTIAMIINFFNVIVFTPLLLALGETKFYAKIHIIFAFSSWILGYLGVITFNSPVAIAVLSVTNSICLILVSFKFTANKLKIPYLQLFPIYRLLVIIMHSVIAISIVKWLLNVIQPDITNIGSIFVSLLASIICLWATSKLFKINYYVLIKPLINK